MKHLKYLFLLLFIVLFSPNAYAYTYDVTNKITAMSGSGSTGGHYLGLEIYNSGSQNNYTVNTRYNGTLSNIEFNLPIPSEADDCFTTNMEYTVTMEMATSDWRNHFARPYVGADSSSTNWATSNVTFVSQKKIYFKFKIPASETLCYGFVYVRLNSPNVSNTAFTGVTNWNLSKISLTDQYSSSGGGSSGGSIPPTPTANPNQNIIDNDNQNTQNIIENNNENTQNIIDTIKDTTSNCITNIFTASNYSSNSSFTNISISNNNITANASATWRTLSYNFNIDNDEEYTLHYTSPQSTVNMYYSFDNSNWNIVNKSIYHHFVSTASTIYIRLQNTSGTGTFNFNELMLVKGNVSSFYKLGETCKSKLDDTNSALNETNNFLQDDSDPSIDDNDFLNMFNSIGINDPLSYLLTLPVQLINKIVSLSDSCTPINLGTLYGTMITLPCINLENILGTSVWNIIDVIFSVSLLVVILKNLYDTFSNLLTMGAEKEAKEKFSMPTPMDFLSMILGGDR